MPDVSVVLTTYNQTKNLKRVLDVWSKRNVELIISDDGSKPRSRKLVEGYGAKYVWQNDRGFRQSAAFQNGLNLATKFWVLFSDVDSLPCDGFLDAYTDAWSPGHMCLGERKFFDPNDTDKLFMRDTRPWELFENTNPYYVSGCNMFMETDAIRDIGGWYRGYIGHGFLDWDVGWRWVLSGRRLTYVPDALLLFEGPRLGLNAEKGAEVVKHTIPLFTNRVTKMVENDKVGTAFLGRYGINQGLKQAIHCLT